MTKLEGITNDQMMNARDAASPSLGLRASFVIRHSSFVICWSVLLMMVVQMCCNPLAQGQSLTMIGKWNVEITFANQEHRSVRLDAQGGGKGTLLLLDPAANVWGAAKPLEAKWTRGNDGAVRFAGPMEFPLGNVGRDAGTLMFNGKFETPDLITGEVEFSTSVGERPSKHGTFKAKRAMGAD